MSQELDENEIAKLVLEDATEDKIKFMFLQSDSDFMQLMDEEIRSYNESKADLITENSNMGDLMEDCRYLQNDHSFLMQVGNTSDEMTQKLKDLVESLKNISSEIHQMITDITNECDEMDKKVSFLDQRAREAQANLIEIEQEIKSQKQTSKEKIHSSKVKVALKEDSLAACERIKVDKLEKLEKIRQDVADIQSQLDNMSVSEIDKTLDECIANVDSLEKETTEMNINYQNIMETLQNSERLQHELGSDLEKFEAIIVEEKEIEEKLQALFDEKQNVFFSLLKAKTDMESKNVYDDNMSKALTLQDQIKKYEENKKELAEIQQKCDEIKEMSDELTSKLNEKKKNIINIEKNITSARETAEQSTIGKEIEDLNQQIKDVDESIQQLDSKCVELKDEVEKKSGTSVNDLLDIGPNVESDNNDSASVLRSQTSETSFSVSDLKSAISSLSKTLEETSSVTHTRLKKKGDSIDVYDAKKRRTQ